MIREIQLPDEARPQLSLFKRSLPMQIRLQETIRAIGPFDGVTGADVGFDNGITSFYLRRRGGAWHTVVSSEAAAEACRKAVPDNVSVMEKDAVLPFKKPMFDVLVISGVFERIHNDEAFIEECHRVLKPDGRLVVHVPYVKKWTFLNPVRRMFGLTPERTGLARAGYTETQLFTVLKNGFDVHSMRTYSRFFVEATDLFVQSLGRGRETAAGAGQERSVSRNYFFANLFLKIADQLDMLIFYTRGHHMVAVAKRRAWRARNTPVLIDGRSISEAVLSKTAD